MVRINEKKFACESCIKGHRTSTCNHTDRQLFEIKRKGRPVSQCEKCRELRKTRRVHSKCLCNEVGAEERNRQDLALISNPKLRRFIPIAPALPKETKGVSVAEKDNHVPDPRYQVDRLLNPCQCKSIWECRCRSSFSSSDQGNLETLLQAAASISSDPVPPTSPQLDALPGPPAPPPVRKSCCAPKNPPRVINNSEHDGPIRGPELPPLLLDPEHMILSPSDGPRFTTPTPIPSMKSVALLAGTGCCCGFECACPDCIEHRVPPSSTTPEEGSSLRPCSDNCPHCIDRLGGIALPEPGQSSQQLPFGGVFEAFLSRAATLPQPPKNRSAGIDPTNMSVLPAGLFSVDLLGGSSGGGRQEEARSAWGLVEVPKLDCCGGSCGCPDGICGCRASCDGCCVGGDDLPDSSGSEALAEPMSCCTNT